MQILVAALLAPLALSPVQDAYVETRTILPELSLPYGVGAVGDVDGDGFADALFVRDGADHLLLGSAATVFTDGSGTLPPLGAGNVAVALGDLNGDGLVDAVLGNDGAACQVFLNAGGALTPGPALGATHQASDVDLADLDGDGDLDVVIASRSATLPNEVWLGDGAGNLALSAGALAGVAHVATTSVAALDFDGDGERDLYLSQASGDRLLLGSPSATFTEAPSSPLAFASTHVGAGDPDADGDADVAVVGLDNVMTLGRNTGGGAFAFAPILASAPIVSLSAEPTFVDVDGDGWSDLLSIGVVHRYFRSLGPAGFVEATDELPGKPGGATALGDVDGDGDPDLVCQGTVTQLLLRGPGGWTDYHPYFEAPLKLGLRVAVGDMNADGADDVVGASANLLLSDGAGGFTADASVTLSGSSVDLVDVDGDGDLDGLIDDLTNLLLLRNDGAGGLTSAGSVGGLIKGKGVEAGDVDGDGDADVLVHRDVPSVLFFGQEFADLRLNDGSGAFSPGGFLWSDVEMQDIELADLDADGDLDLIFAGPESGAQTNDGSGVFTSAPAVVPAGLGAGSVALGDVDGDGDVDAIFKLLGGDVLCLGDGSGALHVAPSGLLPPNPGVGGRPELADMDADGDLDLFMLEFHHRFYTADGTGSFALPVVLSTTTNGAAAVLDLDGDADLDLVVGTGSTPRAMIRVAGGQTARQTPPRIGKPLVMQTYGAPGAAYLLAVAPFAASIPLGAYGTLALDPATVKIVANGAIPSDGRAADLIAVPNVQPLVGATIHWQSLVGTPGTFTGAERMTLTAD